MARLLVDLGPIFADDALEIERLRGLLDDAHLALRILGAEPLCGCASGTPHNDGLAILEAVRRQNLVT
jgi:hypothetical protein